MTAKRSLVLKHTEVVDWRVWKAASVASDGQPIQPGGAPVKAGDQLYVITNLKSSAIGAVAFVTPNPAALALDIAIRASKAAMTVRAELKPLALKQAGVVWITPAQVAALYRYFEECMTAVTFSYQRSQHLPIR